MLRERNESEAQSPDAVSWSGDTLGSGSDGGETVVLATKHDGVYEYDQVRYREDKATAATNKKRPTAGLPFKDHHMPPVIRSWATKAERSGQWSLAIAARSCSGVIT